MKDPDTLTMGMDIVFIPNHGKPTLPNTDGSLLRVCKTQPRPCIALVPLRPLLVICDSLTDMMQSITVSESDDAEPVEARAQRLECICRGAFFESPRHQW